MIPPFMLKFELSFICILKALNKNQQEERFSRSSRAEEKFSRSSRSEEKFSRSSRSEERFSRSSRSEERFSRVKSLYSLKRKDD